MISVVIPVYNKENTLEKCVKSILDQSYRDFEVLLINDGSNDSSLKLCNSLSAKDKRIWVFDQNNQGVSSARNLGLEKAKGEYVYFIDPDDYLLPDCFQVLADKIEESNADIIIFGHVKKKGNSESKVSPYKTGLISPDDLQASLSVLFYSGCGFSVWEKLIRRSFILKQGIEFPLLKRGQDIYFSAILYQHSPKIVLIKQCFYVYVINSDVSKYDENLLENYLEIFSQYQKLEVKPSKNSFLPFLFLKWFAYVVPYNIVGNKRVQFKQKIKEIKKVFKHPKVVLFAGKFKISEIKGIVPRILFLILKQQRALTAFLLISIFRNFRNS